MSLSETEFDDYFRGVHGVHPFPWQARLLRQVIRDSAWPSILSLPTGSGKTAVLDVAVFALACGAAIPRRTALVVDRRIVVDDAFHRAQKISGALAEASTGVLVEVRDALCRMGGGTPLGTALLRGGIYREDRWVRHPAQPLLICSTVDQVGSRLLHRGYGVGRNMRSVHAGLLANDCLIVLDEAHTSEPFRQTLEWISKFRSLGTEPVGKPFAVMAMTATPRQGQSAFQLDDADHGNEDLRRRIEARKTLALVPAGAPKVSGFVGTLIEQALRLDESGKGKSLLVVVNRVATARAVAEKLRVSKKEVILLTGRARGLDRDRLLEEQRARIFSNRRREDFSDCPSLFVVATQCVEVGADLDMDALVSEACPLDSLRQRLGRLDRLGVLGTSPAVLVAPKELAESAAEPDSDPVYGTAMALAWRWLKNKGTDGAMEVGIQKWPDLLAGVGERDLGKMCTPSSDAPVLFPAYCDLWVQTNPEPNAVPEPALFLHGPRKGEPEVAVVWRADLDAENRDVWDEIISACPPVVGETLAVPLSQVRRWLRGLEQADQGSDLEGEGQESPQERESGAQTDAPKFFLRWLGKDDSECSDDPLKLRPGDTIIVPSTQGGCDGWGWAPASTLPVPDLADEARLKAGRPPVLRLHPNLFLPSALSGFAQWSQEGESLPVETVRGALRDLILDGLEAGFQGTARALKDLTVVVEPYPGGRGWLVSGVSWTGDLPEQTSEDDGASRLSKEITLERHLSDVGAVAEAMAKQVGLSEGLCLDLGLAGSLHDLGKADPRFQALLKGGDRVRASQGSPLAKSSRIPVSKRAWRLALESSGYPRKGRHELLSVRLAESDPAMKSGAHDWDLVLHLIASHHGRCRGFAPVGEDPRPREVKVTWKGKELKADSDGKKVGMGLEHVASGVSERFWSLNRKYGWWGLSYLEACLRLADHRASEMEERGAV